MEGGGGGAQGREEGVGETGGHGEAYRQVFRVRLLGVGLRDDVAVAYDRGVGAVREDGAGAVGGARTFAFAAGTGAWRRVGRVPGLGGEGGEERGHGGPGGWGGWLTAEA